ncbi:hypothetical protein IGI04_015743 [Brassica rapa subsp. trilocularis]|uniref:Uncharacterized protein n=1 Tax=Brassica rapa subsp. trilocularis TaxID=1813537 RepID=A0ABQ7MTY2_BRACM|nr:hypothetical protein IGI04_015743 [Brassica rapa subsp. trilocularis]
MNTRSSLSSKWNSNKPTHSVLAACWSERELSQNPILTSWTGWTGLIRTPREAPLASGRYPDFRGVKGLYRNRQRVRRCHPSGCMSSRMLLVEFVVTHGRPHALMHASFTCQKTAPRPDVSQHGWSACVATHRPLDVGSHSQIASIATPRATSCICSTHSRLHLLLVLTLSC